MSLKEKYDAIIAKRKAEQLARDRAEAEAQNAQRALLAKSESDEILAQEIAKNFFYPFSKKQMTRFLMAQGKFY